MEEAGNSPVENQTVKQTYIDQLFRFFITKKQSIIFVFKLWFFVLTAILCIVVYIAYSENNYLPLAYFIGQNAGKLALLFYCITIVPGAFKRFGIKNKIIAILTIYRRYFGITMYLFLLMHYWVLNGVLVILKGVFINPTLIQTYGLFALILLTPLFLTSNDFSLKTLGIWWYRLHKLTYVILFLIFFHVALQRISLWSILAGVAVFMELSSYIYSRVIRPPQTIQNPPNNQSS